MLEIVITRPDKFPQYSTCGEIGKRISEVANDLDNTGEIDASCAEYRLEPKTDVSLEISGKNATGRSISYGGLIKNCPGRIARQNPTSKDSN